MLRYFLPIVLGLSTALAVATHQDPIEQQLIKGNQRFSTNTATHYNSLAELAKWQKTQRPHAVILSCMDSRATPEVIFNQPLGSVFVIRNAGNVENPDVLASLEYATAVVKTPLIMVMGHSSCGAMKAACEDVNMGHITQLVKQLQPAVAAAKAQTHLSDCNNPRLVDEIARQNVLLQIQRIKEASPIIAKLVKSHQVKIVGGIFNLKTGVVDSV